MAFQAVPAHRAEVAIAAVCSDDTRTARDMDHLTVAQSDEMIDDRPDSAAIGGADDVECLGSDPSSDDDGGHLSAEAGKVGGR